MKNSCCLGRYDIFNVLENQKKKLAEWKAEREKKKEEEKEKLLSRPPFKVGIVRHRIYSPISKTKPAVNKIRKTVAEKKPATQANNDVTKRITRKHSGEKAAKITKQVSPVATNIQKSPKDDKIESNVKGESFAPPNYKFYPPAKLSIEPLFGRVSIENSKSEDSSKGDKATEDANVTSFTTQIEGTIEIEDTIELRSTIPLRAIPLDEQEVLHSLLEESMRSKDKSMSCETSNAEQSSSKVSPHTCTVAREKETAVSGNN